MENKDKTPTERLAESMQRLAEQVGRIEGGLTKLSTEFSEAKLQDNQGEVAKLKEEIQHLSSSEHEDEILNRRIPGLTSDAWWQIGERLGFAPTEEEAELEEVGTKGERLKEHVVLYKLGSKRYELKDGKLVEVPKPPDEPAGLTDKSTRS